MGNFSSEFFMSRNTDIVIESNFWLGMYIYILKRTRDIDFFSYNKKLKLFSEHIRTDEKFLEIFTYKWWVIFFWQNMYEEFRERYFWIYNRWINIIVWSYVQISFL